MYSGRLADSLDSVDEIATEIRPAKNLRLLLVVRTADLESDPRLRRLLNSRGDVGRHTVGRLDVEAVTELLEENSVRIPTSELTLDLLRTPLHLSVFSRLSEDARRSDYTTLQELYEAYTREIRASVERRVGHLDWERITDSLVGYMSDNQTLAAPQSVLDAASSTEVGALVSESVLIRDGSQLAFFHESFFDFLFARSFISAGGDLREFLLREGQWLFRRAQVRQVLEFRLTTDGQRFYESAVDLLCCDAIRSHVKALVIDLLRRVPADLANWGPLEELAWGDTWMSRRLVRLLSQAAWFDAADTLGSWETWLDDPLRAERACAVLAVAAKERPSRAVDLLRPYINESEEWAARLVSLVSFSMSSDLVDFTIELIDLGILDDLGLPMSGRRDVWWLVYPLKSDDPVGAARIVGSILRRGLARARAEGEDDPFESDHLSTNSQMASTIGEIARNAPRTFVQEVLPFVRAVAFADQQPRDHHLPTGRRWGFRHVSANHSVDDVVFNATESALRRLATDEPAECARLIEPLLDAESEELRFLACRALAALDDPDRAVTWLLTDSRNLALGWSDSALWASREIIEAHSPNCAPELFSALERTVLGYAPAWEIGELRWRGRDKYELLSAMDSQRLSDAASAVLRELQRKFPNAPPQPPRPIAVSSVGSPIPDSATEHMTDDDWLRALAKHTSTETNWNTSSGQPIGGARQLAQQLGPEAEAQPDRFARLAMSFDATIPAAAMNAVLEGVANGCSADLLAELCGHARDTYGEASGMSVCRAIADANVTDARFTALLRDCAADSDPDHESARTLASSGQQYWGGDLLTAGLNSTRGQAALAIAKALFAGSDHVEELSPTVEALVADPIMAVRVCAAEAVRALMLHQPDAALDDAARLLSDEVQLLGATTVQELLRNAMMRDPSRFGPYLASVLECGGGIGERAGRIWAMVRWHDRLPIGIADIPRELPADARRGAAAVFADNVTDCLDDLLLAFDDEDAEVRRAASSGLWHLDQLNPYECGRLIEGFLASPAFSEANDIIVHALGELDAMLPRNTLTVCERVIGVSGPDLSDMSSARSLAGPDLLAIVLRLYRQGDPTTLERCLDIVDRLVELDIHDVTALLDEQR